MKLAANLHACEYSPVGEVVTAEQICECLKECSPDTREYVLALAKVMPNVLEEWKGRRHNFGTGCALEIIGAMVKMGVI